MQGCEIIEDYCAISTDDDDRILESIVQLLQQNIAKMGACISELESDAILTHIIENLMTVVADDSRIKALYHKHYNNPRVLLNEVCEHHIYWNIYGTGLSKLFLETLDELNKLVVVPGLSKLILRWYSNTSPCSKECVTSIDCAGHYRVEQITELKKLLMAEVDQSGNSNDGSDYDDIK